MNVCNYLLDGKPAESVALLTMRGQHSYGELRSGSERIARLLLQAGAIKGDRALVLADNGLFWVAAYLGILRAGLVCVPLTPKIGPEDLEFILRMTEPKIVFADSRALSAHPNLASSKNVITDDARDPEASTISGLDLAHEEHLKPGLPPVDARDLAALMFTSGSTGKPRGVMVSHGNIIANTESIVAYLSLTRRDRIMAVLPFHYCFGTSLLHTHLRVGGSVVIDSRFMYPEVVLQRMHETGCTGFAGVPSHFQILLRRSKLAWMEWPHLRYVQQAGGQLAPTFISELRSALPGKQIFIMYGQTEATARLSYLPPEFLDTKLGSVGKGIPGVHLHVLKEDSQPVATGEIGEIVAEGDNVALGYWRDEAESARCFREGKLFTGDLATMDEDGFIYIVDRAKDFLKCGGKRVSCRQLENVLLECPVLLEAAIVGEPDDVLGEAAVAYVVPRDVRAAPSTEQLKTHCREHLAPPFIPKRFIILKGLPKNSSGKVLKSVLRSQGTTAVIA